MGRKVRMITITEENMPAIAGRLKKFFEREDKVIFNSWDFNCGFKKYIKPGSFPNYYDSSTFYVEYVPKVTELDESYIELYFDNDDFFLLDAGDKVAFLGDRVITSTTSNYSFWQYDMWQILPK